MMTSTAASLSTGSATLNLSSSQERAVLKYIQGLTSQIEKDPSMGPLPEYLFLGISGVTARKKSQDTSKVMVRMDICDTLTKSVISVSMVDEVEVSDVVKLLNKSYVRGLLGTVSSGKLNNYFTFKRAGMDAFGLYASQARIIGDDGEQENGVELLMPNESASVGKWSFRGSVFQGECHETTTSNGGSITEYAFSHFTLKQFKEKSSSLSVTDLVAGSWYFMTGIKRDAKAEDAFIITGYWAISTEHEMVAKGIVTQERLDAYKARMLSPTAGAAVIPRLQEATITFE